MHSDRSRLRFRDLSESVADIPRHNRKQAAACVSRSRPRHSSSSTWLLCPFQFTREGPMPAERVTMRKVKDIL